MKHISTELTRNSSDILGKVNTVLVIQGVIDLLVCG